jgi:hypothetical protein
MTRIPRAGSRAGLRAGPSAGLAAIAASLLGGAAGCGDNARVCGEGTVERAGVCTAAPALACGPGTRVDHDHCAVDPAVCPAGTVLVVASCVDPTRQLTIDLEESAEPNGRAIAGVEASDAPAGIAALAPTGLPLVIHGHLTPFRDDDHDGQPDPDADTYLLSVAGPTVLDVAVTGVGGAIGGFYLAGDPEDQTVDPRYERYGVAIAGTAVQRRLLLPAAGRYALVIADARALAIGHDPPAAAGARAAAGGPDAEYYAVLTVQPMPAAVPIALTAGAASQTGALATGELRLFSAPLGAASYALALAMPGPAAGSLAVIDGGALKGYAAEPPGAAGPPIAAQLAITGLPAGDLPVIAVDAVHNLGPTPEPFALTIALQ